MEGDPQHDGPYEQTGFSLQYIINAMNMPNSEVVDMLLD